MKTPLTMYKWSTARRFDHALSIACLQALAAGVSIGVLASKAQVFPLGHAFHGGDFDFTRTNMVLPKEEFGSFKNASYFAAREAERQGWVVLLDCSTRKITPLAPEFVDWTRVTGWLPEPINYPGVQP